MIIQPKGYKRIGTHSTLLLSIRKEIEYIAARYNCSKSFVIATLLAEQLNIKEQVKYYEVIEPTKKGTHSRRRNKKVVRIESRKKSVA